MPSDSDKRFEKLELLLGGLAELGAANEPLIDQAYTIALEAVSAPEHLKVLAEALRKKWLSEKDFPPVAVRICKKLSDLRIEDIRFRSVIYGFVINDYRDRAQLRKISRTLFCNSTHFAFEFFRHFHVLQGGEEKFMQQQKSQQRKAIVAKMDGGFDSRATSLAASRSTIGGGGGIAASRSQQSMVMESADAGGDESKAAGGSRREPGTPLPRLGTLGEDDHLYVGFVDPMFEYLSMLIDDMASETEMALFHYLMFILGPYLERRKPSRMHSVIMNVRQKVIDCEMRPSTRALLMELIEFHSHNWKLHQLAPAVTGLYSKYRPAAYALGVAISDPLEENENDSYDEDSN